MKNFCKLATVMLITTMLMMTVLALSAFAQEPSPAIALANLTEGQGTLASTGGQSWDGLSEFVLIPGASLMGATSTTTALYIGFTGGSEADIGNMVLYETPRNGSTVLKVTKLTLGAISDPSINLTSTSVCPVQPVSATNPCIIRLDTVKLALSPLDDYYFTIYFTLDTNNEKISGLGQATSPGALSGWFLYGDQTRIGVKGALPTNENSDAAPYFLAYVTNQ
ncbi:MAG TPA: hypothetical protein VK828_05490 [Terriglobales bacterium]|jgi:hypothetical protein|nr:hypothetical protein [Terriglobales bacterium]